MPLSRCPGCHSLVGDSSTVRVTGHCRECSTWRDKHASHALSALIRSTELPPFDDIAEAATFIACTAYTFADAMLVARRRAPDVSVATPARPKGDAQ